MRWMNRSDHWQNLAWLGEYCSRPVLLTLIIVYHLRQKNVQEKCAASQPLVSQDRNSLNNLALMARGGAVVR
ncbi:hypothetical protein SBA5_300038 [Candidatus Sulfotelmatomonas gaucii]|uniref:Uncharacterized protein n=1 Tax=Candidatus Sulfuritelmatomonas gaucii TaxID=2043161 RepID=A0A2N9LEB7_9BACT|nr:hypothetical protein SBA5_300038 [Candidatus Sulfotelmatomonas gaucii]